MTHYPGYPGPLFPPPRPTNGWAVAALASAFLFAPAAIVCGHVALVQIKRTGEDGKGLAVAGLIVGYVLTVVAVIAVAMFIWLAIMFDRLARDIVEHDHGRYARALSDNQAELITVGPLPLTRV